MVPQAIRLHTCWNFMLCAFLLVKTYYFLILYVSTRWQVHFYPCHSEQSWLVHFSDCNCIFSNNNPPNFYISTTIYTLIFSSDSHCIIWISNEINDFLGQVHPISRFIFRFWLLNKIWTFPLHNCPCHVFEAPVARVTISSCSFSWEVIWILETNNPTFNPLWTKHGNKSFHAVLLTYKTSMQSKVCMHANFWLPGSFVSQ